MDEGDPVVFTYDSNYGGGQQMRHGTVRTISTTVRTDGDGPPTVLDRPVIESGGEIFRIEEDEVEKEHEDGFRRIGTLEDLRT